jgi:hypothetical protein
MLREDNLALITALHELWCSDDFTAIPQIYSADFVAHMPKGWEKSEFRGHDGVREAISRVRNAFAGWKETISDLIVEGDKVVSHTFRPASMLGPLSGLIPPADPSPSTRFQFIEFTIDWSPSNGVLQMISRLRGSWAGFDF